MSLDNMVRVIGFNPVRLNLAAMKQTTVFFLFLVSFLIPVFSAEVDVKLQAELALKIVGIDKAKRVPLIMGVTSGKYLKAFRDLKKEKIVKEIPFTVRMINSKKDISNFNAIFVGKNWKNFRAVSSKARQHKVLMFCEVESQVTDPRGGAVAFKYIKKKPRIVLNMESAKLQGSQFNQVQFNKLVIPGN
ncbi:MAG: YfiR family protein [bacterium]|nr:YfiR family protein [bacterium]